MPTRTEAGAEGAAIQAAAAEYVAVTASQLRRIAEANKQPFLAYLIDMAVLEAWRIASEARPARSRRFRPGARLESLSEATRAVLDAARSARPDRAPEE